jgi:tetratricopeptide (TPR) repeat protein
MQCDPKNAILPANRAMVYLKTESWRQADTDCSLAILLDDGYVKAYQRRATARKELKDYAKALEDLNHVLLLEPNNKQTKSEVGELALLEVEKERPKPPKENSLPASNSEESKVKGMFVPKSGLFTSQLISSETISKMDSSQKKTCIIDCAVGIKELKQDRSKEPLETIERDDVKKNFRKNYIEKEIAESNIVPKNSNVRDKKRNNC